MVLSFSFVGRSDSASAALLITLKGYVGYDPSLNTIVVSHQGTDFSKMYVHDLYDRVPYR
jgi:hypothetical protein